MRMAIATKSHSPQRQKTRPRLGRHDWIEAARGALIDGGIAAVRVERLALAMGVTIGSFYWHFSKRADLLDALLEDWRITNTTAMSAAAMNDASPTGDRFNSFLNVWVDESSYSPAYDSAVRDWARSSAKVFETVRAVDLQRIALLRRIFRDLGYDDDRAEVRARITYFHQVGFYALGLRDDEPDRLKFRPLYFEALRDGPGRGAR